MNTKKFAKVAEQNTKKTKTNFVSSDLENIYPNDCLHVQCACKVCIKFVL